MQVTFEIEDYLNEDQMRVIAQDEFRAACARSSKENFERILSNAGYALVRDEVDAVFDDGLAHAVKAKALDVIEKFTANSVFCAPNAWDQEASKGWTHLQSAVDEAKPMIEAKVAEYVQNMSEDELRELVADRFADALIAKIAGAR